MRILNAVLHICTNQGPPGPPSGSHMRACRISSSVPMRAPGTFCGGAFGAAPCPALTALQHGDAVMETSSDGDRLPRGQSRRPGRPRPQHSHPMHASGYARGWMPRRGIPAKTKI